MFDLFVLKKLKIYIKMVENIKDNGKMENNTEKVYILEMEI
jgi:hypothetical protein